MAENQQIVAVLQKLDPRNDDHWTQAGKPAMEAVEAELKAEVKRAQVDEALPGFDRDTALSLLIEREGLAVEQTRGPLECLEEFASLMTPEIRRWNPALAVILQQWEINKDAAYEQAGRLDARRARNEAMKAADKV